MWQSFDLHLNDEIMCFVLSEREFEETDMPANKVGKIYSVR